MKFYSSPLDVSELEPNMTLSKDKLVFELTHIIAAGNFTTYFDFSNEEFVGYQYYGIEHDKYVKRLEAEKKLRKTLDPLEDKLWGLNQDLKDKTREYRNLQIDQEEEVGSLYAKGDEAAAEKLAQEYGEKFNNVADEIGKLKKQIKELNPKVEKLQRELLKIWDD